MSFGSTKVRRTLDKEWQSPVVVMPESGKWQRNSNWLAMPVLADTVQQINILMAVYNTTDSNWCAFTITGTGTTTVDWGDGTSNTYASGALASHQYSFSNTTLTTTSEVYKQGMIVITNSGNITTFNAQSRPTNYLATFSQQWLDCQIIMPNGSSMTWSSSTTMSSNTARFPILERIYIQKVNAGLNFTVGFTAATGLICLNLGPTVTWTNLQTVFYNNLKLTTVDPIVKNSTTNAATNMFFGCQNLVTCPTITGWQYITSCTGMFDSCVNLRYFNNSWATEGPMNACTSYSQMFNACYSLQYAPMIYMATATVNFTVSGMFTNCYSLITIPVYNWGRATGATQSMFSSCVNLMTIPPMVMDLVTDCTSMFNGCSSLTAVPTGMSFLSASTVSQMFLNCRSLTDVPYIRFGVSLLTCTSMFNGCNALVNVADQDTPNVTTMANMFNGCSSLETAPNISTVSCTNFQSMFSGCTKLKTAPSYTTTAATVMTQMFSSCNNLTSAPYYDLNGVTTTQQMFQNCNNLVTVGAYDLSTVTTSTNMFSGCFSLRELPTSTVSNMSTVTTMFASCFGLTRCQYSGFNVSIDFTACNLSATALNEIFTNLSATGTGKTITITNNPGAATCTRSIATAKGWTVTG